MLLTYAYRIICRGGVPQRIWWSSWYSKYHWALLLSCPGTNVKLPGKSWTREILVSNVAIFPFISLQGFLVGSYGLTWALNNSNKVLKLAIMNSPLTVSSPVPGLFQQLKSVISIQLGFSLLVVLLFFSCIDSTYMHALVDFKHMSSKLVDLKYE